MEWVIPFHYHVWLASYEFICKCNLYFHLYSIHYTIIVYICGPWVQITTNSTNIDMIKKIIFCHVFWAAGKVWNTWNCIRDIWKYDIWARYFKYLVTKIYTFQHFFTLELDLLCVSRANSDYNLVDISKFKVQKIKSEVYNRKIQD